MKTTRKLNELKLKCGVEKRKPLSSTDSADENDDVVFRKRRPLRSRAAYNKVSCSSDADSEPSLSYDSACSNSSFTLPQHKQRIDVNKASAVDEYIFSEEDETKATRLKSRTRHVRKTENEDESQSRGKQLKSTPNQRPDEFKVPQIINVPTPGLSSSLRRKVGVAASPPNSAPLRVSFSDESFSEPERYSKRVGRRSPLPNKIERNLHTVGMETSTPTAAQPCPFSDIKLRMTPKIALPRLSDIASPIPIADECSLKRRRTSPRIRMSMTPQTSGYESMMKSHGNGSSAEEDNSPAPVSKKAKPPVEPSKASSDRSGIPPTPPVNSFKNVRQQRKLAMQKLKEREERYLAEIEELEDFDLCIVSS